jgi:Tfp pilus assembly protein PilN
MPEINLLGNQITEEPQVFRASGKASVVVLSIILIVLIVAAIAFFILGGTTDQQIQSLTTQNTQIQSQLDQQNSNLSAAQKFQAQLANIKLLLNNHIYISQVLDELDKVAYVKSRFASLDVDDKTGVIHVQGNVSSYSDLSKFLLGMSTSTNFQSVRLLSTFASPTGLAFTVDLKAAPQLFTKK